MAINPGDQVRIKSAPDKIGVAIRAIERNGVTAKGFLRTAGYHKEM